jgi:hypothetical protein
MLFGEPGELRILYLGDLASEITSYMYTCSWPIHDPREK